ncbi:unnamed protein product [Diatraea saccharalis]|uniref:Uncharacterized protein n=1 Tax=Diatraea saccharalis TaxID=40085 RepID=A0A9N9N1R5_9NEOP|nr:unnamed protein product [Diatraea saccharalis]
MENDAGKTFIKAQDRKRRSQQIMEIHKRGERDTKTLEQLLHKAMGIMESIPDQIYGSMKREVKDYLEKAAETGLLTLFEISNRIAEKEDERMKEKERMKEREEVREQMNEMKRMMMDEMESIKEKLEEQQKTQIEHREEENRRREDNETNTIKLLRTLDYKMENMESRDEILFDRLADRSLKDGEFVIATITKKMEAIEENITAETIELDRKIGERLGRRTVMEGNGGEMGTIEGVEHQIKETGKEITAEITKTIDTVLTECMQDLHNAITYGGAAPDDNSAVINKIGALETNVKENIEEAKKEITERMNENKLEIVKSLETSTQGNTLMQQRTPPAKTYAEAAKIKNKYRQRTLHSILVTSKNEMDTAEEVIGKTKEILEPEKNKIQIERIRKVKDQRVIISCMSEKETERIREKISSSEHLKVERVRNKNPLVIIKEVKFKMTDDEIRNAIKNQNPDIYIEQQREENGIKIKYRRKTINNEKCHIIAQVPSEMWKKMVTKGHLYIEMERVRVEDQTPLIQCTRCLKYGHGKKFCPDSVDRCSHCGGEHLRAECPNRKAGVPPQCCNCTHAELQDNQHNAFSIDCKVREKWDSLARSTTSYE